MPTRLYRPTHERVTTFDRVTAHEWQATVVGGTWVTLGALLSWTWIDPGTGPRTVLSQLPAWAAGGVALALLVCGIAVLTAVVWPGKDSTAWRTELVALPLGVSAWGLYAIVSPSIFWQAIAFWYIVGAALRVRTVWASLHQPPQVVVLVEG